MSGNYYPINSAIHLRDEAANTQFTVMNDRAQGGSSLAPGRIELMQHRRIPCDDIKGVNEYLNERDKDGKGIRVPATYYVEFKSLNESSS